MPISLTLKYPGLHSTQRDAKWNGRRYPHNPQYAIPNNDRNVPEIKDKGIWENSKPIGKLNRREYPKRIYCYQFSQDTLDENLYNKWFWTIATRKRGMSQVELAFPSQASCLRLVSAVLVEISEEWQTCKKFLDLWFTNF